MDQNIYETEDNVRATDGKDSESTDAIAANADSELPGKFKSVHALAEAYNALQAEFTRRCQRLRELEARADNLSRGEKADKAEGSSKAESGGKAAETIEEKTVTDNPQNIAQRPAPALENVINESEREEEEHGAENGREGVSADENGKAALSDGVAEAKKDEGVSEQTRLKIIADYLSSLKKSAAPLIRGGAGTLSTPPAKPTSIEEAGRMALRHFRA